MKTIRKAAVLAIVFIMLAALFSGCGKNDDAPRGMIKASGKEADFVLYVPETWTVDMSTAAVSAYCSKDDPSSVSLMAWELDYSDTKLDEWWEMNLAENEKVFSEIELKNEEDMTVDGLYAKKYEYSARLGEYEYSVMQVACIKGINVYVFTYTSIPESYESHLADVNSVISNMKIG